MDKRRSGMARYMDDSGEHAGLYVSPRATRWMVVGLPIGAIGVAIIMWLSARPPRDEVDKKIDGARIEMKQDISALRNEIRQDIHELRKEMRSLFAQQKK